jgi:hypothetical protein
MRGDVNKLTPKASSGIEAFWQDAAERKEFGPAVDVEFDSETGRLVLIRKHADVEQQASVPTGHGRPTGTTSPRRRASLQNDA